METKHTPGPWHVERRFSCWAIVDSKPSDLAYQDDAPRFYNGEPCGSVTSRGRTVEELEANAKLIAAAPELLDALQWILRSAGYENGQAPETLRELRAGRKYFDQARAAVAKAIGGTDGDRN